METVQMNRAQRRAAAKAAAEAKLAGEAGQPTQVETTDKPADGVVTRDGDQAATVEAIAQAGADTTAEQPIVAEPAPEIQPETVKAETAKPDTPKDGEKALDTKGEPVAGPKERAGKDAVPAKLSFHDVGVQHAKACSKADDTLAQNQSIIRPQLLEVLKAPQEAWATYTDGFKTVLDDRKKANLPTASLGVLRSRISRLLNTAKKEHSFVVKQLSDKKLSWMQVVKSMPKKSHAGRPETNTITVDGLAGELNVGTLLQICAAAAMQMAKIGKEKAAPFAHYMGENIVEFIAICEKDFQRITGEHLVGGIIKDQPQYLKALGLIKEERQPAARQAA